MRSWLVDEMGDGIGGGALAPLGSVNAAIGAVGGGAPIEADPAEPGGAVDDDAAMLSAVRAAGLNSGLASAVPSSAS